MCISLLSTAHPEYPFILLSNRDEFLNRPTARANWWDPPDQHVLGGRDLQRPEHGTWLGITRQGRIATLTNFREEGVEVSRDKSRGGIVNSFVRAAPDADESPEDFVARLIRDTGIHNVGGFSLLFGRLRAPRDATFPGLAIVSNRTTSARELTRIATRGGETHGLSNSHYGDTSWPKVVHGEQLLQQAINAQVQVKSNQEEFVESLFGILSIDTLPRPEPGADWDVYVRQMRNSILIPPVGGETVERTPGDQLASGGGAAASEHADVMVVGKGSYGTQKQTVILVDRSGRVHFVERTLYDERGCPLPSEERDVVFEFDIEGWDR